MTPPKQKPKKAEPFAMGFGFLVQASQNSYLIFLTSQDLPYNEVNSFTPNKQRKKVGFSLMSNEKPYNKKWSKGFLTLSNVRDMLIIALLTIATWKLIGINISITLESFSFTDLLSVFLAFFAIGLSVAFYFKATDTSNKFYDNSYKFTKEISEILGRIESGFGEKLKHIDDGYTGLRDKFDRIPFDVDMAKQEEEKEKKHIKEQEEEINKVILDLLEKARVADDEKEKVLSQLDQNAKELERSRFELRKLQRKINSVEDDFSDVPHNFYEYLSKQLEGVLPRKYAYAPTRVIRHKFNDFVKDGVLDEMDIQYMESSHLVLDGELTEKGAKLVRKIIESSS